MRRPAYILDVTRHGVDGFTVTWEARDGSRQWRRFVGFSMRDALAIVRQERNGGRA